MPVTEATQGLPLGDCVGVVTHHSGFSLATFGQVPEKTALASAPVIDSVVPPVETAGILVLNISLPTTDADGDALAQSEIVKIRMHHSTNSGVDIFDDYVDFPPGETLQWGPGDTATHYIAVRIQDSHNNWSALSNEESGAANAAASTEPEDDGLWAHRLGVDAIWTEDSPDTDSISWASVVLYWKNHKYTITDGNTNKKYVWWDYSLSETSFQTSATAPTLTFEDVIVAYNDHGKLYLTMYSPMVIADFLRAGILQSTNWAAAVGSQFDLDNGTIQLGGSIAPKFSVDTDGLMTSKAGNVGGFTIDAADGGLYAGIDATRVQMESGVGFWTGATLFIGAPFRAGADGKVVMTDAEVTGKLTTGTGSVIGGSYVDELSVSKLTTGIIKSQSIVLEIDDDEGDVEIRAGIASGDFDNSGGVQGFILGLDDSDGDKAKLYFGGPDANNLMRFMKWTGSVLDVNADLVCTDDFLFAGLVSKRITYAIASPGNALDDMLTNSGLNYTGVVYRNYRVQIDTDADPDKFKWSHDGGSTWEATAVTITGSAQTLEDSITVTFDAVTGHYINDYWDFTAGDTTTNIHHIAGVYKIFASTAMPTDDTRIVLDGFGYGGGIDLYSGSAAGSRVALHAEGSITLDSSGGV